MVILSHDIKFGPDLDRWKYCDVRLTTDDSCSFILGHRNILAQVSSVLKDSFDRHGNPDPYVSALVVQKVNFETLANVIELIYEGKIKIYNENVESNIMIAIDQLQLDIKINKDVIQAGSRSTNKRSCKNVRFKTDAVSIEEIEFVIPKHKSMSPNQGGSSKVRVSNGQVRLGKAHIVHKDQCPNLSLDMEEKLRKQTYLVRDETSHQLSSLCKESSTEESQEKVFIRSLPMTVPASYSLTVGGGEGHYKERGRSASCSTLSTDEPVRSKEIRVRPDILKDVGGNDLNDNLDAINEDRSLNAEMD